MTVRCWCGSTSNQVRALLYFQAGFSTQHSKVLRWRRATNILCYSWLQAEPHCLGILWSKVWAQFSVHTLAKDLLRCKSACRHTPETWRKGESEREGGDGKQTWIEELWVLHCVVFWSKWIWQVPADSVCRQIQNQSSLSQNWDFALEVHLFFPIAKTSGYHFLFPRQLPLWQKRM